MVDDAILKYVPETPARTALQMRVHPETLDKLDDLVQELGIKRAALIQALIAQKHDDLFE